MHVEKKTPPPNQKPNQSSKQDASEQSGVNGDGQFKMFNII